MKKIILLFVALLSVIGCNYEPVDNSDNQEKDEIIIGIEYVDSISPNDL